MSRKMSPIRHETYVERRLTAKRRDAERKAARIRKAYAGRGASTLG